MTNPTNDIEIVFDVSEERRLPKGIIAELIMPPHPSKIDTIEYYEEINGKRHLFAWEGPAYDAKLKGYRLGHFLVPNWNELRAKTSTFLEEVKKEPHGKVFGLAVTPKEFLSFLGEKVTKKNPRNSNTALIISSVVSQREWEMAPPQAHLKPVSSR